MVLSRGVRESPWTPAAIASTIASAMAEYRAEVGQRLRELREAKDLSQEDAAHQLGVTTESLSRWENGRRWPTPDHWTTIKQFYGADPREGVPSPGPAGLSANGQPSPQAGITDRLAALAQDIKDLSEQLQDFRGETAADVAEVIRLLDDRLPPSEESRRQRPA